MKALGRGSIASIVKVALDIAWVVFWIAGALLALVAIVYLGMLLGWAAGWLPDSLFEGGQVQYRGVGVEANLTADGDLHWAVAIPGLIGAVILVCGGLIIVHRLKQLFASFTSDEPFRRENADHLRVIWTSLLVLELSRYALKGLAFGLSSALPAQLSGMKVRVDLRLEVWFAIFTLMILAEVFRIGARMREEQDLTI